MKRVPKPRIRGDVYYLVRRVPKRYASVDPREKVWLSLKTDSLAEYYRRAPDVWQEQVEAWELLRRGDSTQAKVRFEAARDIAQSHGFRYAPLSEVAQMPPPEIANRVYAAYDTQGRLSRAKAEALLGGVDTPQVRVVEALEIYWTLTRDRRLGKSKDQIRRWKNPRIKAINNFVAVNGDLALAEITPDHMLHFKDMWLDRVQNEGLTRNSANKDFGHFADVLNTVNLEKRLHLNLPIRGWRIRGQEKRTRSAFSTEWIRTKLLAPEALAGLNSESRCLLLGMINTGYRPSEGACLGAEQIRLDTEIPYISIEPVDRTLKTANATRKIPLLGVSLDAFREFPRGFDRYRKSADPGANINTYLRANGLKQGPDTTLYSLRHSFQDRMIEHRVDDRLRRELFGHALTEERYGEPSLKVKRDALLPVAL